MPPKILFWNLSISMRWIHKIELPDQSLCTLGFPGSAVGKESTCNSGDPSSIPGSARSTGEGIGSLLQYSWTSLVAQLVKNPPAMWETWVQFLGWDDPLEKGMLTHSVFWPGEFHWLYSPWGCKESDTTEWLSLSIHYNLIFIWL